MLGNLDFKKIFIIVIVAMLLRGFLLMDESTILSTLLTLPGLILGLTVHEFSHAKVADKLGDPSPERDGRLTLNPLAHMDITGTMCLLFAGFGWGKPVRVDTTYFRNPAKDYMKVAIAGPISNFILSFILFFIFALVYYLVPATRLVDILLTVLLMGAYINLSLAVFNLLPFPPLDGSKIWGYFLKGKAKEFLWTLERYSTLIIIILFITDIPELIITPIVSGISSLMCTVVEKIILLFI